VKNLLQIQAEVERLSKLLAANEAQLPTFGHSEQTGRPHIEVDAQGYHYVSAERGHEFERVTTQDFNRLLYEVFRSVTFWMAVDYELHRRVKGKDSRRLLFERQIELISTLSPEWAQGIRVEQTKTLQVFPFDDNASLRASLTRELREAGHSPEDAWRIAREKYPETRRGTIEDAGKPQGELRKSE
jgi:hypothetical protein